MIRKRHLPGVVSVGTEKEDIGIVPGRDNFDCLSKAPIVCGSTSVWQATPNPVRYWLWHIPHGEVTLHAGCPGGLTGSTKLLDLKTPSITHDVHLTSKPGRFLPILVVDARTEDPEHGASVSIGLEGAKLFGKTTNAQGLVRLGPLLPGKYSITVSQYESSTPGWLIVNEVHSSWITVPEGTEPAEALSEQILRVESR